MSYEDRPGKRAANQPGFYLEPRAKRTHRDFPAWEALRRAGWDRRLRFGRLAAGKFGGLLAHDPAAAGQRNVIFTRGCRGAFGNHALEACWQARCSEENTKALVIPRERKPGAETGTRLGERKPGRD